MIDTVQRMKRSMTFAAAIALGTAAFAAGSVSASADDQAAADAAIAAYNERMTEAGGESFGPPDTTPIDPEEYAAENPGSECFGEFATGLDPGGHVEGQTARADGDHFSIAGEDGSDEVDAGIVTVDEDHAETIRDFVDELGSDELASCIEDAFTTTLESAAADVEASGATVPEEMATIAVESESDLGVGDASAHVTIGIESTFEGTTFESQIDVYATAVGRSLVSITVVTGGEPATDFDPVAQLEALAAAL